MKSNNLKSRPMKLFIQKTLMMVGALCLFDLMMGYFFSSVPDYALEPHKVLFYLVFGFVYAGYSVYRSLPGLNGSTTEKEQTAS